MYRFKRKDILDFHIIEPQFDIITFITFVH